MRTKHLTKSRIQAYVPAALAAALTVSMVFFPEEAFAAAVKGLTIWWTIVFPALLPFFIGSELLMGLGVVHFLGVLLEPLMRPLFNVPGVGSFVMAMGLASGFPIGAILTARLRRDELCTKVEGERLMSFSNTADPLFMFGAVGVAMFGYPQIGLTIATAHYLSSISTGFVLRFYGRNQKNSPEVQNHGRVIGRAFDALYDARQKDGRPIGQLMGDAVRNSVNSMLLIGGFIILFAVIIRVFTILGIVGIMGDIIMKILGPLGLDSALIPAVVSGIFEIDLGCELASKAATTVPMVQKIMVVSGIIAWSGLSVHAQVASIISNTDMKITPYILARIVHAFLAALYTWLLMEPLTSVMAIAVPVFAHLQPDYGMNFLQRMAHMSWSFVLICSSLFVFALVINIPKGIKIAVFRR